MFDEAELCFIVKLVQFYFSQSKNDVRWCLFSTVLILIECYGKCSKISEHYSLSDLN